MNNRGIAILLIVTILASSAVSSLATYTFTNSGSINVDHSSLLIDGVSIDNYIRSFVNSSTVLPPAIPPDTTYTVSISGSNFIAQNNTGYVIYTSSNFTTLMQYLDGIVTAGQTVTILDGVYPVHAKIVLNSDVGYTIQGSGSTTIRAMSDLTGGGDGVYVWDVQGDYITTQNLIFDDNGVASAEPVVMVTGNYDTVTQCSVVNNASDYALECYSVATGTSGNYFTFTYDTITHSKYGIATGGSMSGLPENGLIAYNTVSECYSSGIKLRWAKNCVVEYNHCDTSALSWGSPTPGSPTGIRFGLIDGPDVNCTVKYNIITYSGGSTENVRGILVDYQAGSASSSLTITGNNVTGQYYDIYCDWQYVTISSNNLKTASYGIYLDTDSNHNTGSGNTYAGITVQDVSDNGASNTVS